MNLLLVACSSHFSGVVLNSTGQPISNAMVRFQADDYSVLTDSTGQFSLKTNASVQSKYITASKSGYYIGGCSVPDEGAMCSIQLKPISKESNNKYEWLPSLFTTLTTDNPDIKPCQKCHPEITEQWMKSTHAKSAVNPFFLAFFSGMDKENKQSVGPGYKLDFPNSNGNCSTCHVPALALNKPFNSDPSIASGVAREGVFCDLCHKIEDAHVDNTGGYLGTMSLRFNRPHQGHQIFYGSLDDVFPGDDGYLPLYKDSRYCAPCHNGNFWDVEIYSEYKEWAASDYATKKISCQNCHMAPDNVMNRFALEKEGGIVRNAETIPSHFFNGISDTAFMRDAIDLDVKVEQKSDLLTVVVNVRNTKAGHHYPTGNPMRNMILLIDAVDMNDRGLQMVSGDRVPVWGGVGEINDGNYAGLPGKGFAKVLRDSVPYPATSGQRHLKAEYPSPHWRPSVIESDTRIPANGADVSRYVYRIPAEQRGPIKIKARLLYRRAYKNWMDAKSFVENDLDLAQKTLMIER